MQGGGTLPRPRGLVRPRPVAKIPATRNTTSHYFEKPSYNIYDIKDFNSGMDPVFIFVGRIDNLRNLGNIINRF